MIETFSPFAVKDDTLFLTHWYPEDKPLAATVVIAHGMAEHTGRYREFAERLTENGFSVFATDHRGHGRSVPEGGTFGHFSDKGGWDLAVADLGAVVSHAAASHPGLPIFIYGHSMGSFLARDLIANPTPPLAGAVISGTATLPAFVAATGKLLAGLHAKISGPRAPSLFMDHFSFGAYNLCFFPARTPFDWLCSAPERVDSYIEDPLCGYISTAALFRDMNEALLRIGQRSHIEKAPADLPILLLAGRKDPVGMMGRSASSLAARYLAAGIRDVEAILYEGARHELFGEPVKETVYTDIIDWMKHRLS
ncbi:alpha/beta hydrolase [Desulfoluna sp.]|uniref:alpha/beta hydrolase n=1 Tax=Desulfoluna sp. TaxID=2045199 RepID=UPI0026369EAE|nr:alpha/beta hydrolase [Desulfoluna sp.]